MSFKINLDALKTLMENHGFDGQVAEYDYSLLSSNVANPTILIRTGGQTDFEEITEYGPGYTFHWPVLIEVYTSIGATSVAEAFTDMITTLDKIVTLLTQYPYIGLGKSAGVDITLISVSEIQDALTEEGVVNWLSSNIEVRIDEQMTIAGLE